MQKINEINQITVSQNTVSQILDGYGITNFTFEEINEGIDNSSVFVSTNENKYVLRIYRRLKKTNSVIQLELEFQECLKNHDLPIPYVYPNTEGKKLTIVTINDVEWQTILMEYMGKSYFSNYTKPLITEMAETQAKMHLLGISFGEKQSVHERVLTDLKDRIRHEIQWNTIEDEEVKEFIMRGQAFHVILNSDLPYGYNHLDFDLEGNVLIKNDKITGILDFDDLAYSPCIVCLGYTLWHVLYKCGDMQLVKYYLYEYENVRQLTKEEYAILPQVMLFRNYVLGALELTIRKNLEHVNILMGLEKEIKQMKFGN